MAPLRVGKKFQVTVPDGVASEARWHVGEQRFGAVCDHRFEIGVQPSVHHSSVRLRDRNQITLPADVCRQLMIVEGGLVEMRAVNDRIVITPVILAVSWGDRPLPIDDKQGPTSDGFTPIEQLRTISKRARRVANRRKIKT